MTLDVRRNHTDGRPAGRPESGRSFFRSIVERLLSGIVLAALLPSFVYCFAFPRDETGLSLRVADEVAPAGGIALIRVELTEPKPISGGSIRFFFALDFAPAAGESAAAGPLGTILAVGLLSRTGDVAGGTQISAGAASVNFSSAGKTYGVDADLPLMVIAVQVSPGAQPGLSVPISVELASSSFLDPQGTPYQVEVKQGTFTVGGLSVTHLRAPSVTPGPGATVTLQGVGFQQGARVNIEGAEMGSVQVIGSTEIRANLDSTVNLNSARIRVRNPDNSEDFFYAIPELRDVGQVPAPPLRFAETQLTLIRGSSADVTVRFLPALAQSETLIVSSSAGATLAIPGSIPAGAGALSATFRIFGLSLGSGLLTVTLQSSSASLPVTVVDGIVLQIPVIRNDSQTGVGLAITNRGTTAADVQLKGFLLPASGSGVPPAVTVVISIRLQPLEQVSRFLSQYDSRFEGFRGWVEISSREASIHAMFLNASLGALGFAGSSEPRPAFSDYILPQPGGSFSPDLQFVLVNNGSGNASLTFEWNEGGGASAVKTDTLPPQSGRTYTLGSLLPEFSGSFRNGYLRIRSSTPITAYQQASSIDSVIGVVPPAVPQTGGSLSLPQFVAGGRWYTTVSLVNPSSAPVNASLTLLGDRGTPIAVGLSANPVQIQIPARGQRVLSGSEVFGIIGPATLSGTLRVDASGLIVGSAVVGEVQGPRFVTAVPLFAAALSEAVFSQVATGRAGAVDYFTGLAFYNPNPANVGIQVEVRDGRGALRASFVVTLASGERMAKLLSELAPGITTQIGGHIHVTSSLPVYMLEIFGNDQGDFLTTVPPSVIR